MTILLIRLRLVGDVVFTTPIVRALRRRFPDAHITYLVEPAAAPVIAGNPCLDEVLVAPRRRGWLRPIDDLRLALRLRRNGYDLVINLHGGPRASWLSWATRARRRIGYVMPGFRWLYTDAVARPPQLRARHSVENQSDLLAPLNMPPLDPRHDPVEMSDSLEARTRVEARLRTAGVSADDELVVMHVCAGNPFRRWPAAAFAALGARLSAAHPARRIVLTSGPSDTAAADRVAAAARASLPGTPDRILRCGEFDLLELQALIARASLFIGGDSGPLHVAATTETPIVGLFGPTLAVRSAPWRDPTLPFEAVEPGILPCRPCGQRTCAPGDFRCLTSITADRVAEAAERMLAWDRESEIAPLRMVRR
jgi:predicted lipopolysaccharide heptosyltransferase III